MSAGQLERLQEQMQRLRLFKSRERLEALLQLAGEGANDDLLCLMARSTAPCRYAMGTS